MPLNHYVTLGQSGLRVSPLCLGAMTFGEDWGWGSSVKDSESILDRFVEHGGNFIDTANIYTKGHSEKIIWQCDLRDASSEPVNAGREPGSALHVTRTDGHAGRGTRDDPCSQLGFVSGREQFPSESRQGGATPLRNERRRCSGLVE
jgi:hypothetical protein